MEGKKLSSLLSKLREPLHISYISKYILKEDLETTQKELDDLVEEGLIIESPLSSKYYVIKIISTQE
jgi:vacuolar-type H+-ATPase subunit I/STV1